MATLYFCALPSATTPTWNRANIGTNAGFSDTPPMYGTQGSAPAAPRTDYEPTISWTGSLTAGTSYKLWAIWDDGTYTSNSGSALASAEFTTYARVVLSSPTYVPGSITATTARGRVTATEYA